MKNVMVKVINEILKHPDDEMVNELLEFIVTHCKTESPEFLNTLSKAYELRKKYICNFSFRCEEDVNDGSLKLIVSSSWLTGKLTSDTPEFDYHINIVVENFDMLNTITSKIPGCIYVYDKPKTVEFRFNDTDDAMKMLVKLNYIKNINESLISELRYYCYDDLSIVGLIAGNNKLHDVLKELINMNILSSTK